MLRSRNLLQQAAVLVALLSLLMLVGASAQSGAMCQAHHPSARGDGKEWRKFRFRPRRIFQPYASLMPASIQPAARSPRAVASVKRANLKCTRCVHSKLALFTKAPEGTGSENTFCLPAPIQIFKKIIVVKAGGFFWP
jgi:hypothetical protein